ncbi:MAG: hypothetical protein H8E64_06680 [Candidatus Marinimicrobia bacterium]|nr:hypothetical protein [Candidatus Neomarinimicrobiota bacterium]
MKIHILILGTILTSFSLVSAQNAYDAIHLSENEFGFGTKALGMGGAFTGLADDYSAIYWNPAGLGQLADRMLYSELTHSNFTNDALYNNELTSDSRNYTHFGSFGFVRPVETTRGSLVFAFGYNRIQGFDKHLMFSGMDSLSNNIGFDIAVNDSISEYYPFDINTFRSEEMVTEGGIHEWTAGGAVMLSPNFTVGLSAALRSGSEDYRLHYQQTDINNNFIEYPADFHAYSVKNLLQSEYTSLVLKIGGMFTLGDNLSLGGTITLPSITAIDEIHSTDDVLTFDDGYEDIAESTGQFEYRIKNPFIFDGGLALHTPWLTVSGSARYRDWSQVQFNVDRNDYDDADYREFLDENETIRQNYQPTVEYRLGGELSVIPKVTLRGGYVLIPSPLKQTIDDRNKEYFTGGISLLLDRYVSLDATMITGKWRESSSDSYTPEGTQEDISITKFTVGFSYRF